MSDRNAPTGGGAGSPGLLRRAAAAALVAVLTGACADDAAPGRSAGGTPAAEPSVPPSAPSEREESSARETPSRRDRHGSSHSGWEVGASPLPRRADGLGEMRRTPRALRERALPTVDLLPPPEDGRFQSTVGPVTPAIRRRMGATWSPRCPVALDGLRYLTVTFRGFDGLPHTGELVVAASEASDIVSVFRALYAAGFPIEEMRLPTTADLEAPPTGDGNNTAALVCRATTGGTSWSAHAYGLAIDLNPFQNPYRKGDVVLPELASSYLRRDWRRPGMVHPDSLVVRQFARVGWSWGGAWSTLEDYQHFSATGR